MLPNTLRELIRASRRTAKEFKQVIEDVAELIREKQAEHSLQREPVRVPIRNQQHQHPLSGRVIRRQFSTTRDASASFKNLNKNILFNIAKTNFKINVNNNINKIKPSITNTFKAAIYQNQPFRSAKRVQLNFIRGGLGSGMYTYFPKHNARMFSTFGPNVTHQAVENLSQSLRTFFIKGGKVSHDCLTNANLHNIDIGHFKSNDDMANKDFKLASTVSETAKSIESGCFVEFDLSTPSIVSLVPESGLFDDDLSSKMEKVYETSIKLQTKVLNDVKLFRDNIGSTSYKFDKNRERLRFYCPNCEVYKMENLLSDAGITMGIVKRNEDTESSNLSSLSNSSSYYSQFSQSGSELSTPELESDYDSSILSSLGSSNSNRIDDYSYLDMEISAVESISTHDSILSSSDEYFDVSSTAIRV